MEIPTRERLIQDIENYLTNTGMKPSEFGKKYFNDSGALSRLSNGTDPRLSTIVKIYKIIEGD